MQEIYEDIIHLKTLYFWIFLRNILRDYQVNNKGFISLISKIGSIEMLRIIKGHGDDPNHKQIPNLLK